MGIYTNYSGSGVTTNYTDVQPFVGESFNYHELGIIAASEMTANHNSFMKSIALSELAAFEQTGSTDVLYESVNISGIIDKIKMFFKKIIEKIHKIFHTFIAKMSSWFGNNKDFAKKYEKEVIKNWGNVKEDWEFKGYKWSHLNLSKSASTEMKVAYTGTNAKLKALLETEGGLAQWTAAEVDDEEDLKKFRENLDTIKESVRKDMIDDIASDDFLKAKEVVASNKTGYDQSEFTEELFKVFRSGEDSKEDLSKTELLKGYGGSISGLMSYIKEFDKIKKETEASEKKIISGIDSLIKKISKAQDEILKSNKDSTKTDDEKKGNELVVQASAVLQGCYGALSEMYTQAFSAMLQAQKDACAQAKEVAVKVIGQSKKMTESTDYSSGSYSSDGGFDFIGSVKLV